MVRTQSKNKKRVKSPMNTHILVISDYYCVVCGMLAWVLLIYRHERGTGTKKHNNERKGRQ